MASLAITELPDDILVKICRYLSVDDVLRLNDVSVRFRSLSFDRDVVRYTSLQGSYLLADADIKKYFRYSSNYIQVLNMNHCYWLSYTMVAQILGKCRHLQELHVIECRVHPMKLSDLISKMNSLTSLSFSIRTVCEVNRDNFRAAEATLNRVRKLHLYFCSSELEMVQYRGEHPTIIDFCLALEELQINSQGIAVPELYRPIVSNPLQHPSLRVLRLTNSLHAGAQMFFYGIISQLSNSDRHLQSLLMPNVNFKEFCKKPVYVGCLNHLDHLEELDISGTKIALPKQWLNLELATRLRYLNVCSTRISSTYLATLAASCPNLTSVNLHTCPQVFTRWRCQGSQEMALDLTGVLSLFSEGHKVRHLNLAGEHHHLPERMSPEEFRTFITSFKDLKSLSLSVCMLGESSSRSTKRPLAARGSTTTFIGGFKKRRTGISTSVSAPVLDLDQPSTSGDGSSRSEVTPNSPPQTALQVLAENNPQLSELELMCPGFVSIFHKNKFIRAKNQTRTACREASFVDHGHLQSIAYMSNLRRLTLANLPGVMSGVFLVSIAQHCPLLEFLSMAFVGGAGHCVFSPGLQQALPHFRTLQDLRIEHPSMSLGPALFDSLCQCCTLQRLCIITKHSQYQPQDILRLMNAVSTLVVLQMFTGNSLIGCRTLASTLNKTFGKKRPALSVTLYPMLHDGIMGAACCIPAKHFEELTVFESRVCAKP